MDSPTTEGGCTIKGEILREQSFHTYVLKCKKYWKHAATEFGTPELKSSLHSSFQITRSCSTCSNCTVLQETRGFFMAFLHALQSVSVCCHSHFLKIVWICNLLAFPSLYYILVELQNALNWYFKPLIYPVHPKGNQSWVFIGRTDAEAETLILWPPHVISWLIGKDPDAGRDWGQEKKGTTEDEMAGWHHRLDGREFE